MTVLGKILVFANLVFSVATAAMIVTVFSTRTNWKENYDKAVRELRVAREDRNTYANKVTEADRIRSELEGIRTQLIDEKAKAITLVEGQLNAAKKELEARKVELDTLETNFKKTTLDAEGRLKEVVRLQGVVKDREQAIVELKKLQDDLRVQKTTFEIQFNREHAYNKDLLEQVQTLSKQMTQLKAAPTGPTITPLKTAKNPPAEDLDGLVKATDASGYVTVTLGSDAGLAKGHTLEVWRTEPEPKYLGTIRIVAVEHHEAVGKPVSTVRAGSIRVGDHVGTIQIGR